MIAKRILVVGERRNDMVSVVTSNSNGISLKEVFQAKSVAVIGASATPGKTGYTILKNIVDGGYKGQIYPVNPRSPEILGLKAYASLGDIKVPVDLGVFVVPAALVPGLILEAKAVAMKGAIVISGGFGEVGNTKLEQELMASLKSTGIRLIGPNCQGINYTPNRLCATWPLMNKQGPIAIVSQSGTVGAALSGWAEEEGVGISGFVSLGNKLDVDEMDLLDFFADDPHTKVIALYVEGIRDGNRFISTVKSVAAKKHLVILKGGRTSQGRIAAQSHTKSVAGKYEVFSAICRDLNITAVKDLEHFYDSCKAQACLDRSPVNRLMLLTSSGGSGIMCVDEMEGSGLTLASLSPTVKDELRAALPDHCVVSNPLDLTGDTSAERYQLAASIIGRENIADLLLFIFGDPIPETLPAVLEAKKATGLPVTVVYVGGGEIQKQETVILQQNNIPVYPTPERAIRAIRTLMK
jgi:acyl-CoA synthetase (NDP forming)